MAELFLCLKNEKQHQPRLEYSGRGRHLINVYKQEMPSLKSRGFCIMMQTSGTLKNKKARRDFVRKTSRKHLKELGKNKHLEEKVKKTNAAHSDVEGFSSNY